MKNKAEVNDTKSGIHKLQNRRVPGVLALNAHSTAFAGLDCAGPRQREGCGLQGRELFGGLCRQILCDEERLMIGTHDADTRRSI